MVTCKPSREVSAGTSPADTLILDLQPPEMWRNFCCLSQPVCGFFCGIPSRLVIQGVRARVEECWWWQQCVQWQNVSQWPLQIWVAREFSVEILGWVLEKLIKGGWLSCMQAFFAIISFSFPLPIMWIRWLEPSCNHEVTLTEASSKDGRAERIATTWVPDGCGAPC